MTLEERIQHQLGQKEMAIIILQFEIEQLKREIELLKNGHKANAADNRHPK